MTEDDRRFVELTAETVSTKMVDKVMKSLPCESNEKKIDEHDRILHDGLKKDVKDLEGLLGEHQQRHHNSIQEKSRSKRAFWRGFLIAIITTALTVALTILLPKLLGG